MITIVYNMIGGLSSKNILAPLLLRTRTHSCHFSILPSFFSLGNLFLNLLGKSLASLFTIPHICGIELNSCIDDAYSSNADPVLTFEADSKCVPR